MTKSNKTLLCCLLTCVMVLACALTILPIATPTTANAETVVTFDFTAQGYSDREKVSYKEISGVGITFDKRDASTEATYYTNGTALRVYGGTITIKVLESSLGNISNIAFTFGSDDGSNVVTVDKGTYESPIWNGNENTVIFSITKKSGNQKRIQKIVVTLTPNSTVECEHTTLNLVAEVAATCTATGVKEHYKCANVACGKLFDKNTEDKQEVTLASLAIAALDHQWNDGEITTAATCTTDGVKHLLALVRVVAKQKPKLSLHLDTTTALTGNARFVE